MVNEWCHIERILDGKSDQSPVIMVILVMIMLIGILMNMIGMVILTTNSTDNDRDIYFVTIIRMIFYNSDDHEFMTDIDNNNV